MTCRVRRLLVALFVVLWCWSVVSMATTVGQARAICGYDIASYNPYGLCWPNPSGASIDYWYGATYEGTVAYSLSCDSDHVLDYSQAACVLKPSTGTGGGTVVATAEDVLLAFSWGFGAVMFFWSMGFAVRAAVEAIKRL